MRDDQRNYIMVGAFVIIMIAGLILWIALLSGRTGATDTYYIHYADVLGLSEGTQIYYNGYPVGMIESIEPSHDGDDRLFRLEVSIRKGWKIPEDSKAEITASGLLSAVVINIGGGSSTTALSPGDQIQSVEATNLLAVMTEAASGFSEFLLDTLKPQLEGIVADLGQTMDQVNTLLSPANTGRIERILMNLEGVSEEVEGMTAGLTETQTRLDNVLKQVETLLTENEDTISQSVADLHESLEAIARRADAIAHNLEMTTRNMNEFSQQIRENPGVIIRGRSAAEEPMGASQ